MPAVFTSPSMRPWRVITPSTRASTDAVSVTSSDANSALPPVARIASTVAAALSARAPAPLCAPRERPAPRPYRARSHGTRRSRSRLSRSDRTCGHDRAELLGRVEMGDACVGMNSLDETAEHRSRAHPNIRGGAPGRKTAHDGLPLDWRRHLSNERVDCVLRAALRLTIDVG